MACLLMVRHEAGESRFFRTRATGNIKRNRKKFFGKSKRTELIITLHRDSLPRNEHTRPGLTLHT